MSRWNDGQDRCWCDERLLLFGQILRSELHRFCHVHVHAAATMNMYSVFNGKLVMCRVMLRDEELVLANHSHRGG